MKNFSTRKLLRWRQMEKALIFIAFPCKTNSLPLSIYPLESPHTLGGLEVMSKAAAGTGSLLSPSFPPLPIHLLPSHFKARQINERDGLILDRRCQEQTHIYCVLVVYVVIG